MPNYRYQCKDCGKVRTVKHRMDEEVDVKCDQRLFQTEDTPPEVCGGECERILSAPNVIVRGGTPTFH